MVIIIIIITIIIILSTWRCYTWEWSKRSGHRFPAYILSLWKDQRDILYNINRIIIIIIIIVIIIIIIIIIKEEEEEKDEEINENFEMED